MTFRKNTGIFSLLLFEVLGKLLGFFGGILFPYPNEFTGSMESFVVQHSVNRQLLRPQLFAKVLVVEGCCSGMLNNAKHVHAIDVALHVEPSRGRRKHPLGERSVTNVLGVIQTLLDQFEFCSEFVVKIERPRKEPH